MDRRQRSIQTSRHRACLARAVVDNPDGALKPMMFASFSIITGEPVMPSRRCRKARSYTRVTRRAYGSPAKMALWSCGEMKPDAPATAWWRCVFGLSAGERVVTKGTVFIDRAGGAS